MPVAVYTVFTCIIQMFGYLRSILWLTQSEHQAFELSENVT